MLISFVCIFVSLIFVFFYILVAKTADNNELIGNIPTELGNLSLLKQLSICKCSWR